jgi:hypothetical protein
MKVRSLLFASLLSLLSLGMNFGLTGCAAESDEPDDVRDGQGLVAPGASGTLRERLATSRGMTMPAEGTVQLTASRKYDGVATSTPELGVDEGRLALRAEHEGALVFDQLDFQVADVTIGADTVPPAGLTLTDIRVHLERPAYAPRTEWSDDGSFAQGKAEFDLLLDWSILGAGGQTFPLATQRIAAVPAKVSVGASVAGEVTVSFDATVTGTFWSWAGIIEMSDLHLVLQATY